MVGAAIAVGAATSMAGAAMTSSASSDAANQQAQSAADAQQQQMQMFNMQRQTLQPYTDFGKANTGALQQFLDSGTLGEQFQFAPTMEQLAQTPGYQFQLQQGEQALNQQMAAKGLNLSGAQARGINQFAQGLAGTTYQQQYQNALTNFLTNRQGKQLQLGALENAVNLGENAAANVGQGALATGQNVSNLTVGAGNAQAAGTIGSANAISGGLQSAGSNALLYQMLNGGGGGGASPTIYGQTGAGNPNYFTM